MTSEFGLPLPGEARGGFPVCLVIGNFDGVHLGHRLLLEAAREQAERADAKVVAITFEPHPRSVLLPGQGLTLLTPLELRRRILEQSGADRVWVIPFDRHTREISAQSFLDRVGSRCQIRALVAGPSVSIGKDGAGGIGFLRDYGQSAGFQVRIVEPRLSGGEPISSSRIREHLAAGELGPVAQDLGRWFNVLGQVERGEGRGRVLGFPTANLRLSEGQALPPDGVYATRLAVDGKAGLPGVASIGRKPHFGGGQRVFEVHVLEDPGDLYGRELEVDLLAHLRGQEVFDSDAALVAQMELDCARARSVLSQIP